MSDPIDFVDFMRAAVAGIEDLDHRVIVPERGETLSEEVSALLEADGYEFYCSPAADKITGRREVYFARERQPTLRM
jgi:hypothetical protein